MSKFYQKKYVSKYTGKEIDDAVAKAGTALQNPMTAAGDIIVGGEDGAAEKLTKGADGKVLKMVSGAPAWADDSAGMTNPMTAAGDMIAGSIEGAPYRLPKGTQGQVLTMGASFPEWAAPQSGGHLYWHTILYDGLNITKTPGGSGLGVSGYLYFIVLNTSSTNAGWNDIKEILDAGGSVAVISGWVEVKTVSVYRLFKNNNNYCISTNSTETGVSYGTYYFNPESGTFLSSFSDSVHQIM